jgi:mRNA interferase RelE/StbE
MTWGLVYSQRAREWMHAADRTVSEQIVRKLESTRENPHHFFERMASSPDYKLRIGDYRVIADLQDGVKIIAVIRVGHRKKVYQEF